MKRIIALLCLVALCINVFATIASAEEGNIETQSENTIIITDPGEIAKYAASLELTENPDDIVQIVITNSSYECSESDSTPLPAADIFSEEEIVFEITSHNPSKRGNLLRSSDYVYPGGTMTISESVDIAYSTTVELSAEIVSAEMGFDVNSSINVSDAQNIEVPYGKTYTCNAYTKLDHYEFNIIGDDVFFDDNLGTGVVDKPIGVIFVVLETANL